MTKRNLYTTSFKVVFFIVFSIIVLATLQRLVMPKYMHGIIEGAMIAEYYEHPHDHDVVFIGDCEVYENFSPVVLWNEYGISSYIRGSAQQLIWQSYYIACETLTYERPQAIVFNVLSMEYNKPQSEAYNRMTIDGMRMSKYKLGTIKASMTEEEHYIEYLFPILRYHDRVTKLEKDDITYFFKRKSVTHNGYYMRVDVKPAIDVPEGRPLGDYSFGESAWKYLEKLRVLCEENDVELILIKAPSLYPYWYREWDEQILNYADLHDIRYYNLLTAKDEIGLDFMVDTYDAGLHLNLSGAEKLSHYFGKILTDECGIKGQITNEKNTEWNSIVAFYNDDKAKQVHDLSIKEIEEEKR